MCAHTHTHTEKRVRGIKMGCTRFFKTHIFENLFIQFKLSFDEPSWFQRYSCLVDHSYFIGLLLWHPKWSCSSKNFYCNVIIPVELHFIAALSWFKGWKIKRHLDTIYISLFSPSLLTFGGKSRVFFSSGDFWWWEKLSSPTSGNESGSSLLEGHFANMCPEPPFPLPKAYH